MIFSNILSIPSAPNWQIEWESLKHPFLEPFFEKMAQTPQNPDWHGEGDVWTHTQMVCESLTALNSWRNLPREKQEILFVAALLHDIGKPECTTFEDGKIVSRHHARIGAGIVRQLLWKDFEMGGTPESQQLREAVCSLIQFHSAPPHILDVSNPVQSVLRSASDGDLVPFFTNRLLSILAEADLRGRVASNIEESLELLPLFRQCAAENDCLDGPFPFSSAFNRFAWFHERIPTPNIELFDNTWGEIILLSALPGTGKDTYYKEKFSHLPVVSLDDLREKMKVNPEDEQGAVVAAAKEQAKEFLRKRQPFVWNATNVSSTLRASLIQLFVQYGASVRIVYLETVWNEMLRRNRSRSRTVPDSVYVRMIKNLELPSVREAHQAEWICR